jgi:hypothetical protein
MHFMVNDVHLLSTREGTVEVLCLLQNVRDGVNGGEAKVMECPHFRVAIYSPCHR